LRRELHDFGREVLFVTDRDGTILDVNVAGGAALGIDVDLEQREALVLCVGEADGPRVRRVLETISQAAPAELELHLRSASGRVVWAVRARLATDVASVLWSAAALDDREATTLRRLVRDKSELLERERTRTVQAETANEAKNRLLAIVAEDSRAMLNAVLGWTQMLRREVLASAAREHALAVIEGNIDRHLKLFTELLDISRVVDGDVQLELEFVEFDRIVDEVVAKRHAAPGNRGVTFHRTTSHPTEGALTVLGDQRRLECFVEAVIDRIVDAGAHGSRIGVTTRWEQDAVVLRVATTEGAGGPGSPPMLRGSTAAAFKLTSALVDRLARVHRGTVAWSADEDGQRAVEVRMPREAPPIAASLPPGKRRLSGLRVVVYEPRKDVRELAMGCLRAHGANVIGAREAPVAAAAVTAFDADVVVTNVTGTLEDGEPLLERLRADTAGRDVPIVGLAASPPSPTEELYGIVDEVVETPFDPDALVRAVSRGREKQER
jgi:hypothetical protein